MTTAAIVSLATFVANVAFYTAYSKADKTLKPSILVDLVTTKADKLLVELNKVFALCGITMLVLAAVPLPSLNEFRREFLLHSLGWTVIHSSYSFYKYYGDTQIPLISKWLQIVSDLRQKSSKARLIGVRKMSNATASIAFTVAAACYAFSDTRLLSVTAALVFALAHFYTMEVDFKMILHVRPFGLVPMYVGAALIVAVPLLVLGGFL